MRVAIIMTVVFSLGLLTIGSLDVQAQDGCLLEMRKSANPADDRVFDFLQTGPEDQESEFGLSDPDNPTTVRVIPFGGAVNITELVPSGWKLENIECVNGTNNCGPGTFIPCLDIIPNLETNHHNFPPEIYSHSFLGTRFGRIVGMSSAFPAFDCFADALNIPCPVFIFL